MKESKQILGGGLYGRAQFGCTVTFENEAGKRLTYHRTGPPADVLRQLCEAALAKDDTYRVISYSTPQTIYTDLQGERESETYSLKKEPTLPEEQALGRIGMLHMLRLKQKPRAA